jgi:hypothetical protein
VLGVDARRVLGEHQGIQNLKITAPKMQKKSNFHLYELAKKNFNKKVKHQK